MGDRLANALRLADEAFGYSFNLTRLVDGEATYTLVMTGFKPLDFEDREEGNKVIAERRAAARASAVIAALFDDDGRAAVLGLTFANQAPIEWNDHQWSTFRDALVGRGEPQS